MSEPTISDNRSKLKDFIASIATIRGDLSNITAPPFVLSKKSTVELPSFWAERPSVFVAPAAETKGVDDPARRALLVLRWFLSSLRGQQYAGRSEEEGVKKPLNAFLGEVFLARWDDEVGTTWVVSEQVSHHPPVTACRVWNDNHGVSAEGYTRQEITFNGSVNVQQIGHATLHLAAHNETYLIPLPNVKIKGIFTGGPYPELQGTYHIPCTSGYTSRIEFGGKGFFSSADKKHSFEATLYRDDGDNGLGEGEPQTLYRVSGNWDGAFTIHDTRLDSDIETFDVRAAKTTPLTVAALEDQDPWESQRAWHDVHTALDAGDMQGAADAKAKIETGQRQMRRSGVNGRSDGGGGGDGGDNDGANWHRLFFEAREQTDEVATTLGAKVGLQFDPKETVAAWRFRRREWDAGALLRRPFRGRLAPDNTLVEGLGEEEKDTERGGVENVVSIPAGPAAVQAEEDKGEKGKEQRYLVNGDSTGNDIGNSNVDGLKEHNDHPGARIDSDVEGQDYKDQDQVEVEVEAETGAAEDHQPDGRGDGAGTKTMKTREKAQVEEFLRDQYSSSGR